MDQYGLIQLVGCASSGKTVFYKQCRIHYSDDKLYYTKGKMFFTMSHSFRFPKLIRDYIVKHVFVVIDRIESRDKFPNDDILQNLRHVFPDGISTSGVDFDLNQMANDVKVVFTDIPKPLDRPNFNYFIQNLKRIFKTDYIPSEEDFLKMYISTSSTDSIDLSTNGSKFKLSDVGGKPSERRKWDQGISHASHVLYLVPIDLRMMDEDPKKLRLLESLECWKKLIQTRKENVSLIFTMADLFSNKDYDVLSSVFPKYSGGSIQKMIKFVQDLFLSDTTMIQSFVISTLNFADIDAVVQVLVKGSSPKPSPVARARRKSGTEMISSLIGNIFGMSPVLTSTEKILSVLNQPIETSENVREKYRAIREIGTGGSGSVYLAENNVTKELFVMKRIHLSNFETMNRALSEVKTLYELRQHPHINTIADFSIEKKDSFTSEQEYILVILTNYCEGGDLGNLIQKTKKSQKTFTEEQLTSFMNQLLSAIEYIHENEYLHADMKPENVFLDKSLGHLSIGDFGLSGRSWQKSRGGTPDYMSPEQTNGEMGSKSDIWALGCLFMDLLTLERDIWYCNEISSDQHWLNNRLKPLASYYSSEFLDLIRQCLKLIPEERPDIKRLKMFSGNLIDVSTAKSWSHERVGMWLSEIGFSEFVPLFQTNQIDGSALLLLEKSDLSMMGISQMGIVVKIASEIRKLK